jgi:hypothetical protein
VEAEDWIAAHVEPAGPLERAHVYPWATTLRVPIADGAVWFKACAPVQAFEVPLTLALAVRWPDRAPAVRAHDVERAWLLLEDAGRPMRGFGRDGLDAWLQVLPLYAELQLGEAARAVEHLAAGVPDQRLETLPAAYDELLEAELELEGGEVGRLHAFAPRFRELCSELDEFGLPPTLQHDDLHDANVLERDGRFTILDWGDSSIGHPFASLLVTLRTVVHVHSLEPGDPWLARLRDAYLRPWEAPVEAFELAQRIASLSRALTWRRFLEAMTTGERVEFRGSLEAYLRRFLAEVVDAS